MSSKFVLSENPEVQQSYEDQIANLLETVFHPRLPLLQFFRFRHLPPELRAVSCCFADLACRIAASDSAHPVEQTVALRKLLEAKDAAVRSALR